MIYDLEMVCSGRGKQAGNECWEAGEPAAREPFDVKCRSVAGRSARLTAVTTNIIKYCGRVLVDLSENEHLGNGAVRLPTTLISYKETENPKREIKSETRCCRVSAWS